MVIVPKMVGVIVYNYLEDKELEFNSYKEAAKHLGVGAWVIRDLLIGASKTSRKLKNLGVTISLIDEKKVREHKVGKLPKKTGSRKIKIHVLDLYTNEILDTYNSSREAADDVGGHHTNITKCCRGTIKNAYGYKWEYAE